ncbi:MAG: phthiocerol/phthiodiolone dimycocerosyl transferase family protein [Burkholderiaceae bacterium]
MKHAEPLIISRRLDPGERFFWMLDKVSGMNFVVYAEIGDVINADHLRAALKQAQQAHPLLRVKVEQSESELRFEPSDAALGLEQIAVNQQNWQVPIESELAHSFTLDDAPLMRVRYLHFTDQVRSVLALTFHHSIADARSGSTLLREILHYLVAPDLDIHFKTGAVHPALHQVFPAQYDWQSNPEKVTDLAMLKKTEIKRYGRSVPLPWLNQQQSHRVPRFHRIELDIDATKRLIHQCKIRGVSVHGALSAAQLLAKYQSTAEVGPLTLSLSSPADMRPYLSSEIPTSGLGLYVTILASTYQINGMQSFWDVAREVGTDIKRQLDRGDGHLLYELIKPDDFPINHEGMNEFANLMLKTPQGSMISNIGIVEPVDSAAKVESITFVLSPMPYQIVFSAVSTYGGKLIINMAYDAAKLSIENAKQLTQWMEQALLAASDGIADI